MDEMLTRNSIRFNDWEPAAPLPGTVRKRGAHISMSSKTFWRNHAILILGACLFTLYTILLSSVVSWRTEKRVREEMENEYTVRLETAMEAHKEEQAQQKAAEFFLSGDASREAAINQAVEAVAPVIAKLSTDAQKYTEASCMLARVMNPGYPNTFQEVVSQPLQWMFYDGTDKTFSDHDREIAESIVRPYMESGKIPNGLTAEMVHGAWSTNDFVLRDSYEGSGTMNTWRYGG